MGSYLQKPVVEKSSTQGQTNSEQIHPGGHFTWGSTAMQGWRTNMEDAHIHLTDLFPTLKGYSLFVVFDGHSGAQYANTVSKEFPSFLLSHEPFKSINENQISDYEKVENFEEKIKNGIRDAFLQYDIKMAKIKEIQTSGCTATGVMITPSSYFFMNIGDSRSILCTSGMVKYTTIDHKPTNSAERARIEAAGGHVTQNRVNGQLAVSRALGDFEMKRKPEIAQTEQLVSPEPVVDVVKRSKGHDDFIAVCCDGIYDVMSNDELRDLIYRRKPYHQSPAALCEEIADYCCFKGSKDNLSVVIIMFNDSKNENFQYHKNHVTNELVKLDQEIDNEIKLKTEAYVHEAFKDGRSAYGWEACFSSINSKNKIFFRK